MQFLPIQPPFSQRLSVMQNWLQANRFIERGISGLQFFKLSRHETTYRTVKGQVSGTMLDKYHELQPKPKTTDKLKAALQTISEELSQEHVNKSVGNFCRCPTAYMAVAANGGHSKHLQQHCPSSSLHPHLSTKQTGETASSENLNFIFLTHVITFELFMYVFSYCNALSARFFAVDRALNSYFMIMIKCSER